MRLVQLDQRGSPSIVHEIPTVVPSSFEYRSKNRRPIGGLRNFLVGLSSQVVPLQILDYGAQTLNRHLHRLERRKSNFIFIEKYKNSASQLTKKRFDSFALFIGWMSVKNGIGERVVHEYHAWKSHILVGVGEKVTNKNIDEICVR